MARIAGVNIPNNQHTVIGLTAIFGIGTTRARQICKTTGVAIDKKVKDLTKSMTQFFNLNEETKKPGYCRAFFICRL